MLKKKLSKLMYYAKLAFKKPKLILAFIFKRHLGIILSIPIKEIEKLSQDAKGISFLNSKNKSEIYEFYKRMNRESLDYATISKWIDRNFDCFIVYSSKNIVIGAMWIFKEEFILDSLSGRTLSPNRKIKLDTDTIYGAYVIIDKEYRGSRVNQQLLNYVINYYSNKSNYKSLLIITGANNGPYIRTTMKKNAKLIGITEIINILGFSKRKEYFLDVKEKNWR